MHCGLSAQADITKIIAYTDENFGRGATPRYEQLLVTAFRDLSQDPTRPDSIDRAELGAGIRSFHLRRSRTRAKHASGLVVQLRPFILYRYLKPSLIGIGRVLHDAVDADRHLPPAFGDEAGPS